MKIFRNISFGIYTIGFILKILHYMGAAPLMALGILLSVIAVVLSFIIKKKDTGKREKNFTSAAILFLFIYFYARIQFLPGLTVFMLLAMIVCLVPIMLFFKNKEKLRSPFIIIISLLILAEVSYFAPYSTVYYIINLNNLPFSSDTKYHTASWDMYSWQLYWDGNYDKALQANDNAIKAVHLNMAIDSTEGESAEMKRADLDMENAYLKIIIQHRQAITNRNWTSIYD